MINYCRMYTLTDDNEKLPEAEIFQISASVIFFFAA